ncbi:hypothetical protein Sta7437_1766 [Stanieria cyanosphaera PCC 7437]|uniref:Uncharacterized protein n=1 Tax=Stanieria cyanosphaera (strain ATCC 29371 / PCC 7437) TaxID=111780 RepID=K9XTD3_STAC7|nr:hypothetical protein [Stanieria cyanosphaera]AFZ35324.1 hypothetical protein Sta7437_1766 [Stanieria cyanosphaera PCC 7437]
MKSSIKTPASLRYLKARLIPFSRPIFWGSLSIVFIFGLVIYQYWQNPELLNTTSTTDDSQTRSQLSSEDLAVGADLDNVDLLLQELESQATIPLNLSSPKNYSSSGKNQKTVFNQFKEQQKAKLNNSSSFESSSNNYSNNLPINRLSNQVPFNSSNFNSISPLTNYQGNKNNRASENIIPNPVGKLYLSNRNQSLNTNNLFEPKIINSTNKTKNDTNLNNSVKSINIGNSIESVGTINSPNYNSPQIIQPQFNYSINPKVNNNNAPYSSSSFNSSNPSEKKLINYQLPLVNYSNNQSNSPNNYQDQSQNTRQSNQTNPNLPSTGLLQPSSLNKPNF